MAKTQKFNADIVIIGAGAAGLTLACLLGSAGLKTHVVEPFPPKAFDKTQATGRTVALMKSSITILRAAGLDGFCEEYGENLEIMRVIDDSVPHQESITSEFDSFDLGLDYFAKNIPNALLHAKLFEAASANQNITLHAPDKLEHYEAGATSCHITLESGTEIIAPLIIGADGRNSKVRELAGIKMKEKAYGQSAITFIINHSSAHNNTSTEFHRPGGPFALVPMKGNQCSVVWVENTDRAEELIKLPKDAFQNAVQEASKDLLGAITLESSPQCWPLKAMKAPSMTANRTALIAETIHVMSPITAQGLNLSLRDVATLAEVIVDAARIGADYGSQSILRKYQKRRAFDVDTRTFGVSFLNQFVNTDKLPIKDMRRAGLKILENITPLKMMAMKHGLAPSLDEGRLVRGEAL